MLLRHFLLVVEKEFNFTPKLGNSHINFHQELVLDKGSSSP